VTDFVSAPSNASPSSLFLPSGTKHNRDSSTSTIKADTKAKPLFPQNTGEWGFPSFRQSLLGGKSLNRFSTFVTSGAEEWILKGKADDIVATNGNGSSAPGHGGGFGLGLGSHSRDGSADSNEEEPDESDLISITTNRLSTIMNPKPTTSKLSEVDKHFVDSSHNWKAKVPPFRVMVHSPSKRTSVLSGAYTMYSVTSLFQLPPDTDTPDGLPSSSDTVEDEPPSPTAITVYRRYSHFVVLHTALTRRLPGIALPPLPEKQYTGRFSDDFVEARRGDLERYLGRVVRHPVARYAEVLVGFLGCESESVGHSSYIGPDYIIKSPLGMETSHPNASLASTGRAIVLCACLSSRV
jgi:sorting nexin-9/18/33